eukprot:2416066-Rhodomonas_salina.7
MRGGVWSLKSGSYGPAYVTCAGHLRYCLRARYAVSGTDVTHRATARYAMSGTDVAYQDVRGAGGSSEVVAEASRRVVGYCSASELK